MKEPEEINYQVSAIKHRPKKFSEVVGQEHVTITLKNSILNERISHAYLFTGPRGVGKTTTARILARAVNCENPVDAEPCNTCRMCSAMLQNKVLDVYEIDAASNRGIDEIRQLRESVRYSPTHGKYKVFIIDEVHMLTMESFNAFLKTLEEPPAHVVFIFATTDIHKVPLTIISRCQRYDFRRIPLETTKEQLQKIALQENITIDDKTLTLISKRSDGGLRDAESFFDQAIAYCGKTIVYDEVMQLLNMVDQEIYFQLIDAFNVKDFKTVFSVCAKVHSNGWDLTDFLEGLIEQFRNLLAVKASGDTSLVETAEVFKPMLIEQSHVFSESDLLRMITFTTKVMPELRYSGNRKIRFELLLCQLCGIEKTLTMAQLINKVEKGASESETYIKVSNTAEKKKLIDEPVTDYSISSNRTSNRTSEISAGENTANSLKPVNSVASNEPALLPLSPKNTLGISENQSSGNLGPKPKLPLPKKKAHDTEISTLNSEQIEESWKSFIATVARERGPIMDEVLKRLSFKEIRLGKIYVSVYEYEVISPFLEQEEDYFNKKISETFKKQYSLQFTEGTVIHEAVTRNPNVKNEEKTGIPAEKQPVIDFIKGKMGGVEMRG